MKKEIDAFFSHNSQDKPIVERIAEFLEDSTGISVWLDKWNLIPGEPWQEEIEKALDESKCCVVFLGPNGVGPWQNEEMRSAIEERVSKNTIRVLPVLLPGASRPKEESRIPGFLRRLTWVIFQQNWDEKDAKHRLLCGIKGIPPGRGKKNKTNICPFRGLEVFREQDKDFFFGREAVVQRLMHKMETSRFLAVLGPSGCGKSSVVQAGLIPLLCDEALVTLFTPRERPIEELAFAMRKCYGENKRPSVKQLIESLMEGGKSLHYFARDALEDTDKKKLVFVIDQFEELFTQTGSEDERRTFIMTMLNALEVQNGPIMVIITMRSDFIGKCAFYPDLNTYVSEHFFQIEPMSVGELRQATVEPAHMVGLKFESGLVNRILNDLKRAPGELPLLEHALLELYEKREGALLSSQAYDEIGGIGGALVNRAEEEFNKLDDSEKKILRKTFVLRLIQPGEGTEDTRRRVSIEELLIGGDIGKVKIVLDKWINARLLTITQDTVHGRVMVDVAHEALISQWDRIKEWMAESKEAVRLLGLLRQAAREWEKAARSPDYLFHGARLVQMDSFLNTQPDNLTELEIDFINDGIKFRKKKEQEKEAAKKRELQQAHALAEEQRKRADEQADATRKIRNRFGVAVILAVVALGAVFLAVSGYKNANKQKELAEKRLYNANINLSINEWENANIIQMQNLLTSQIPKSGENDLRGFEWYYLMKLANSERIAINGHKENVISAGFSFDGKKIASVDVNNIIKIWDSKTGKLLVSLPSNAHKLCIGPEFVSMAFSPVENIFASAGYCDSSVKIWNFDTGENVATYILTNLHENEAGVIVYQMEFAQNGKTLALLIGPNLGELTFRSKVEVTIMDVASGKTKYTFKTGEAINLLDWDFAKKEEEYTPLDTKTVGLSPNKMTIATCTERSPFSDEEPTVKLWDLNSGKHLKSLVMERETPYKMVFSPKESIIAIGGNDIILWDVALSSKSIIQTGYKKPVKALVFSSDGKMLASASEEDNSVRVWDTDTLKQLANIKGHKQRINSIEFSPDCKEIITASKDNTIKVWNLERILLDFDFFGSSFIFSPDGRFLISWDLNTVDTFPLTLLEEPVGFVDMASLESLGVFKTKNKNLEKVKPKKVLLSPNGKFMAIEYMRVKKILVVDLASMKELYFNGTFAEFSPDNKNLILSDDNGIVRLFSTTSWKEQNCLKICEGSVDFLSCSPDRKILAIKVKRDIELFDTSNWKRLSTFTDVGENIKSLSFSSDSRAMACLNEDSYIKIYNINTKKALVFGERLDNCSDEYTGENSENDHTMAVDHNEFFLTEFYITSFSPDSNLLITVNNSNSMKIWNAKTGQQLFIIANSKKGISAVSFSNDSKRIATASIDGILKLWDTKTSQLLITLAENEGFIKSIKFSPDDETLITTHKKEESPYYLIKFWHAPK